MVVPIPKKKVCESKFWIPENKDFENVVTNSWFDGQKLVSNIDTATETKIDTTVLRCNSIKLNPSYECRKILDTWFEIYRRVYNTAIRHFRKNKICNKLKARSVITSFIKKNKELAKLIEQSDIYKHTTDNAIFDVVKAYKTGFANLKGKNIKFFRLRYKKASSPRKIIVLEPTTFNDDGTGLRKKALYDLKPSEIIRTSHDVRLGYCTRTKQYTLHVPCEKKNKVVLKRNKQCSLDPGIRTFQTIYSDSGTCVKACSNLSKIQNSLDKIDKANTFRDTRKYKKCTGRLYDKIRNRIADLHWKTAKYLCTNYDNIYIGKLSTKSIVGSDSVLIKRSKRLCYALSHYLFRQRLLSKAEEYNTIVHECDESYTTKTCGKCGEQNDNVGSSKIFRCPCCNFVLDRDVNGARNIMIKNTE